MRFAIPDLELVTVIERGGAEEDDDEDAAEDDEDYELYDMRSGRRVAQSYPGPLRRYYQEEEHIRNFVVSTVT